MINVNPCPGTRVHACPSPQLNSSQLKSRSDDIRFGDISFDNVSDRPSSRTNRNASYHKFDPAAHSYQSNTVLYDYENADGDRASTTADPLHDPSNHNEHSHKFHHLSRTQRQHLKRLVQRNRIRKIRPVYWRRLVEVGVPVQVADVIAKAIAQYDASRQQPNPVQQHLIREYCRFVCRAELWRSQLLVERVA